MGQPGIGVLIGALGGNDATAKTFTAAVGKTIKSIELRGDDALYIDFEEGGAIRIRDDGQSCCETRYMRTDDDLASFVGAKLLDGELKEAPSRRDEYGDEHEVQFLELKTTRGSITMTSHNEHNGYYGGFWIVVESVA